MEIEIISKESIKPSSPTPTHLKTFKLSILDQLIVIDPYVPIVLYYPNDNGNNIFQALERSLSLKKSLSKILTQFYPLAGTIKNDLSIDCNDVGAYYALALVRCRLEEFLSHPDHKLINRLLPIEPTFEGSVAGTRVSNVQVNIFECGGIAVSLCISHKIVDAAALYTFLNGWTKMALGAKEVVQPNFTAPSLFPAKGTWLRDLLMAFRGSLILKEGRCSQKRFVFDSDAIAAMKAEATRNGVQNPTRVEVVTALIWKCAMAASKQTNGFQKPSLLTHMVNLRKKLASNLSKDFICNVLWFATATCRSYETTLHGLVNMVQKSISKVDFEFVSKAQGEKGYVAMQKYIKELGEISSIGTVDHYIFSSWCKMGFYQLDFGWGKPSWVTGAGGGGGGSRVVNLMDTKFGEGIEAWVNLDEEEMEILQGNSELLAYASLDPSPLAKLSE